MQESSLDMRLKTGKPKMAYLDNSKGIKELESAGEVKEGQDTRTIALRL